MLVVNRFEVPEADHAQFVERGQSALRVCAQRPGFLRGQLGRAADEPALWCLVTEWESVGAYRRALSNFDVKVHATPFFATSIVEPSAFEVLAAVDGAGPIRTSTSDRAGASHVVGSDAPSSDSGPCGRRSDADPWR